MEIEEVGDCAVVGRPDEDAGELPVAFVVPKHEGVKEEDIKEYVASRVAPYKKIRMEVIRGLKTSNETMKLGYGFHQ